MVLTVLIALATIMAVFGVIGYLRGTTAGLMTTALIWGGLILAGLYSVQIARIVNGMNLAVRFLLAGGQTSGLGAIQPLIPSNSPGVTLLVMLGGSLLFSLLLSSLKSFRGRPSLLGLVLGLLNGYAVTGALVYGLAPDLAFLPMPFGFSNTTAEAALAAPAGLPGSDLWTRIPDTITNLAESPSCPVIIAITIAAFVFIAVRTGNRGKKG